MHKRISHDTTATPLSDNSVKEMEYLIDIKGRLTEHSITELIRYWHLSGQPVEPTPVKRLWNSVSIESLNESRQLSRQPFPTYKPAQGGRKRANNEAILSEQVSVLKVGLKGSDRVDYFYYEETQILIANRLTKSYLWKRMPKGWHQVPYEEITDLCVNKNLFQFLASYRIQKEVKDFVKYMWEQVPNDYIVEFKWTIGPQLGFNLGKTGVAKARAEVTLASFGMGSNTFEKRNGKLKETHIIFTKKTSSTNFVQEFANSKNEDASYFYTTEVASKIGLEVSVGNLAAGGTVGQVSNTNLNYGGEYEPRRFYEVAAKETNNGGKLIQEFKYGLPLAPKIETGWEFEVKCILGVEIKVVHEKTKK